jgi:hypothetical protein
MNKQDHIELFNIEAFVVIEGVCEIFKPLWDVGFLMGDNSIYGSKCDFEEHIGSNYGSFGSPLFVEKTNYQVNSYILIIDTIFVI